MRVEQEEKERQSGNSNRSREHEDIRRKSRKRDEEWVEELAEES